MSEAQTGKAAKRPSPQRKQKAPTKTPQPDGAQLQPGEFADRQAVQRAVANPHQASLAGVRGVQRAYGNRFWRQLATNGRTLPLQPKLTVNEPDDPFEQEAEAVADALPTIEASPPPDSTAQRASPPPAAEAAPTEQTQHTPPQNDSSGRTPPAAQSTTTLTALTHTVTQRALSLAAGEHVEHVEPEAETVAEATDSAPEHVPPVGGADGGNGDNNPIQRKNGEHGGSTAVPDAAAPPASPIRRGVPNQLKGALFQKVAGAVQKRSSPETAVVEEEEDAPENSVALMPEHAPPFAEMAGYDAHSREVDSPIEQKIESSRGSGHPLPPTVQAKMESHLGSDLSRVRVHTNNEADTLNRALDAEAFTTGSDIFFRNGRYDPHSHNGQKLLAHELTHVVQQGAAPPKPVQRQPENSPPPASPSANGQIQQKPANPPAIQRGKAEKARAEAERKAARGQEAAERKKSEKTSAIDTPGSAEAAQTGGPRSFSRTIPSPKFPNRQSSKVEARDKVNQDTLDYAEPEADTGGLGWLETKAEALPDWDAEVGKYDNFLLGNFADMGLDLSGLEGDTTGIEVDKAAREQMVMDALSGGVGGDGNFLGPHNLAVGVISDAIPFGGNNAIGDSFYTEGPSAWWKDTKGAFKKTFQDIGDGFKGLFEEGASGWARAASAIEIIIGVLELVRNVVNVIRTFFDVLYIAAKIFAAMARLPFIGYLFKWAVPIVNAVTAVFSPMGQTVIMINLLIRRLRPVAIAFRVIDMLYYESDPEKLMDRQAKLLRHVRGMKQSARDNIRPGISEKYQEERQADDMLVGTEYLEDPRISPFSIENVAEMKEGSEEKADYKKKFLAQYGIPDVSDLVIERLQQRSQELPPPPLAEYGTPPEKDVRKQLDANAIAIMHLRRQRLGLENQTREIDAATEVAANQKQIFQAQRDVVASNKEAMQPHKQDINQKLQKQDALRGKATQTNQDSQTNKQKGLQLDGMAGLIIGFIKLFMWPLERVGATPGDAHKNQLQGGPKKNIEVTEASIDATGKGIAEADTRTGQTKQAEKEAQESESTLDETDAFLSEQQEAAQEGIDQLQAEKDAIEETQTTLQSEEERLMAERTEALNDAVAWMAEWRETREAIFQEIEAELKHHYKENEEKDEDEDKDKEEEESSDEEFGQWSVYDKQKDMGDLEGEYLAEGFEKTDEDEFDL